MPQGFVPRSFLMGRTSKAECKPWASEIETQELGDDDPGPIEYPEPCITSKSGVEAASGTRGFGKASDWGFMYAKGQRAPVL